MNSTIGTTVGVPVAVKFATNNTIGIYAKASVKFAEKHKPRNMNGTVVNAHVVVKCVTKSMIGKVASVPVVVKYGTNNTNGMVVNAHVVVKYEMNSMIGMGVNAPVAVKREMNNTCWMAVSVLVAVSYCINGKKQIQNTKPV